MAMCSIARRFAIWQLLFLTCLFLTSCSGSPSSLPTEFEDVRHYVNGERGGRTLALQLLKAPRAETARILFVYRDGQAQTDALHEPRTQLQLPREEQEALEQLRRTWCKTPPPKLDYRPTQHYYALTYNCTGGGARQVLIEVEALPPALQQLVSLLAAAEQ
jgi:hypothetical protein